MVYLGYEFSLPIIEGIDTLPILVKESLSKKRAFISSALNLFRAESCLSETAVGISIMENYTGQEGFPETEESQAWHSDYGSDGLYDVFNADDLLFLF